MLTLVHKTFAKARRELAAMTGRVWLRHLGVHMGQGVALYGIPVVALTPGSEITIGDRVVLCSWSGNTALGVNHEVVLRTFSRNAKIVIGDDVGISGGTICAAVEVTIGDGTLLGANVTIADTDFHPIASPSRRYDNDGIATAPVAIGRNVFLGTNSIVLKGVTIGDNSVIGAGSVVTKDIPDNVIAGGNPCHVLKPIESALMAGTVR